MITPTTIGTWATARGYTAVSVQPVGDELLLVAEHHTHPDDPQAGAAVLERFPRAQRQRALAQATGRVLARGGHLRCEPEQLAESPVWGQARAALAQTARTSAPIELSGRDGQPVERRQAQRMFDADLERYVHAGAPRRTPR